MDPDTKQLIWIFAFLAFLGYIFSSSEYFTSILFKIPKDTRDSFMIYGTNNKSKPKVVYNT